MSFMSCFDVRDDLLVAKSFEFLSVRPSVRLSFVNEYDLVMDNWLLLASDPDQDCFIMEEWAACCFAMLRLQCSVWTNVVYSVHACLA